MMWINVMRRAHAMMGESLMMREAEAPRIARVLHRQMDKSDNHTQRQYQNALRAIRDERLRGRVERAFEALEDDHLQIAYCLGLAAGRMMSLPYERDRG